MRTGSLAPIFRKVSLGRLRVGIKFNYKSVVYFNRSIYTYFFDALQHPILCLGLNEGCHYAFFGFAQRINEGSWLMKDYLLKIIADVQEDSVINLAFPPSNFFFTALNLQCELGALILIDLPDVRKRS